MNGIFCNCIKLKEIPDISKWNTKNVKYLNSLFCGCESLKELPNISVWNTLRVEKLKIYFLVVNY